MSVRIVIWWTAVLGCVLLSSAPLTAAEQPGPAADLLLHARPLVSSGVRRAAALTDGLEVVEGGSWQTKLSAHFADGDAYVSYDLGRSREIRAAQLQADHNDVYLVELSNDGHAFDTLWKAQPIEEPGMRTRFANDLHGQGRYVRLRARAGDGGFLVSELLLFSAPRGAPAEVERRGASPLDRRLRDRTLLFGLCLLVPLLLPARVPKLVRVAGYGVALIGIGSFARGLYDAWPAEAREVSLVRGVLAFVAAAAVARDALWGRRYAARSGSVLAVLGLCAPLSLLAFYNLGHPQFYDAQQSRWVFAHYLDLRQYYPTAKYFRELGYTRIYYADLAAELERRGERGSDELATVSVRDLDSLEPVQVGERTAQIRATRARFSAARWAAYMRDATWFHDAMGSESYLETLLDYGGNATPFWMSIAHLLFAWVDPGDHAFTALGLLDLVLLLGAFAAIGVCFGPRTALVSAIVFGTNDFVMFGTNWSGATLRHDWLAYLALGACALKRERYALGGSFLALATLIRAFPALAFVGVGFGALWRVLARGFAARRLPALRELMQDERAVVRIALGACLTVLAGVLFSFVVLGHDAWPEWWSKVSSLEAAPHPAKVALSQLVLGWDDQIRVLHARRVVYYMLAGGFTLAIALAARNRRPEQAAVLGLLLVPVLLGPANYYLHLVFVLPLLAVEHRRSAGSASYVSKEDAKLWLALLWMCALQYFTELEPDIELHFYFSTALLFACMSALLWLLLRDDEQLGSRLSSLFANPQPDA